MKVLFSFIIVFNFTSLMYAQEEKILPVAQEMPTLEACAKISDVSARRQCTDEKIDAILAEHLVYPDAAKAAGVDGFVIVRFVVDEKGKAIDHTIDEDPGFGMGEAALKAVKRITKWTPGKNMGKPVKVRMTVPVKFIMPEEQQEVEVRAVPDVFDLAEKMPRYQGCDNADDVEARNCTHQSIAQYIRANLVYPEEARKQSITGTVIVKFVVSETGLITDAEVEKGLGGGCDEEALRLVKAMPQWSPGMQGGKPVKVRLKLPFQFLPTEKE